MWTFSPGRVVAVALITGGNRGLGLQVARELAAAGWRVLVGARDLARGRAAAATIGRGAEACALDLDQPATAAALADALEQDGVVLDALVNNAAISLRGFDARVASRTITTNLLGTLAVTGALQPRLRDGGGITMVSSGMGELARLREPARGAVAAAATVREAQALAREFVAAVARGTHRRAGWPDSAYTVSKALLNVATRGYAAELAPRGVRVNAVCPGWVRTDLGGPGAERDVVEGARSILRAVREPRRTGTFFRDGAPIPW